MLIHDQYSWIFIAFLGIFQEKLQWFHWINLCVDRTCLVTFLRMLVRDRNEWNRHRRHHLQDMLSHRYDFIWDNMNLWFLLLLRCEFIYIYLTATIIREMRGKVPNLIWSKEPSLWCYSFKYLREDNSFSFL